MFAVLILSKMKTTNPFNDLSLSVNPKAIFECFSHEAKSVSLNERVRILKDIVVAGYDLNKVIRTYLKNKVALEDEHRINNIITSLNCYTQTILEEYLNSYKKEDTITDATKELIKQFYDEQNILDTMEKSVNILVNTIKEIYKKKTYQHPNTTIKDLLISYINRDTTLYNEQSKTLNIDLNEDILEHIKQRDKEERTESPWHYYELYSWFKGVLLQDLKNNQISYYKSVWQIPAVWSYNSYIKKFFPKEDEDKLKADRDFRQERLLDFAEKVVNVLWKNQPLFDEPSWLVRCNYRKTDRQYEMKERLYADNKISICIQDYEEEKDGVCYEKLQKGEKVKKAPLYISRFCLLAKQIQVNDILVISEYSDHDIKLGLLKKGTEIEEIKKEGYTLYCLQMKSVYCGIHEINSITLQNFPILKGLMPHSITLSPIKRRTNAIRSIYYGYPLQNELDAIPDEEIEKMCNEWLTSSFALESIRIVKTLMEKGKGMHDIDVLGLNKNNQVIAAQVSYTDNVSTIKGKYKSLLNYKYADKYILCTLKNKEEVSTFMNIDNDNLTIISLNDIWKDFNNSRMK